MDMIFQVKHLKTGEFKVEKGRKKNEKPEIFAK